MPISFLNAALLASHSKRSRVGLPAASTGGTCNRSLAGASRISSSSSRSFLLRGRWELTAVASGYGHALAGVWTWIHYESTLPDCDSFRKECGRVGERSCYSVSKHSGRSCRAARAGQANWAIFRQDNAPIPHRRTDSRSVLMSKIGLISDVHGDADALEMAWGHLKAPGRRERRVCRRRGRLRPLARPRRGVFDRAQDPVGARQPRPLGTETRPGRRDEFGGGTPSAETLEYLRTLPFDLPLAGDGRTGVVVHGSPRSDMEFVSLPHYSASRLTRGPGGAARRSTGGRAHAPADVVSLRAGAGGEPRRGRSPFRGGRRRRGRSPSSIWRSCVSTSTTSRRGGRSSSRRGERTTAIRWVEGRSEHP